MDIVQRLNAQKAAIIFFVGLKF